MTDEELIARLRDGKLTWGDRWNAADRIEALVKERDEALEWLSASQGYIADAVYALDKQERAEARAERLEAVLQEFSKQKTIAEMTWNGCADADFEGAYDTFIFKARAALKGADHE